MGRINTKTTKPDPAACAIIASGAHEFKFINYTIARDKGIGGYSVSDTFKTGDISWAIYFYPSGNMVEGEGDCVSFIIKPMGEAVDQGTALFKLVLVDQSGKGRHSTHGYSGLASRGCEWGSENFLSREFLWSSGYLKYDCIHVRCWIWILGDHGEDSDRCISAPMELKDIEVLIVKHAFSEITGTESYLRLNKRMMFDEHAITSTKYLRAVDTLQALMNSGTITDCKIEDTDVLDMAMKRLQLEFKGILKYPKDKMKVEELYDPCASSTGCSNSLSTFSYETLDADCVSQGEHAWDQLNHLQSIIKRLNSPAGCLGDCMEAYKNSRKTQMEKSWLKFGLGKWSISNLRSWVWEASAGKKMKLWIQATRFCFGYIFPGEKEMCELVFHGVNSPSWENCFLEITRDVAIELFNSAEVITRTHASVQKLFDVLDIYNALSAMLPTIKTTFDSVSLIHIYLQAANTLDKLAIFAREILSAFEYSFLHEQSNTPLPGGTTHPMTRYAMKYVIQIIDCRDTLTKIINSKPITSCSDISYEETQFMEVGGRTPLVLHLIWIIIILKFNLERKSEYYRDTCLRYFFMLNNFIYILGNINGSVELREMIGEDYIKRLEISKNHASYLATWDSVLFCLREEGLYYKLPFYKRISRSALKRRLRAFNFEFGEICRSCWKNMWGT